MANSLPIAIFLLTLFISIVAHRRFSQIEDGEVRILAAKSLDAFRDQMTLSVRDRALSLERMARRLDYGNGLSRRAWFADAETYRQHLKGLESIAVVDPKNEIKWVSTTSPEAENLIRSTDQAVWESIINEARKERKVVISRNIDGDDPGGMIVVPLFTRGKWTGSLVSFHRFQPFLSTFYKPNGYEIEIQEGGQTLYSTMSQPDEFVRLWGIEGNIDIGKDKWLVRLVPRPETVVARHSNLPLAILIAGILMGALFSAVIHLALNLRLRSRAVEEQRRFLDTVIDNLPVAVFCQDHQDDFRFSIWNKKCEELFGMTRQQTLGKTVRTLFPNGSIRTLTEQRIGDPTEFEERVVTEFSGAFLLQTQKISVNDDNRRPLYTLGISEDVSRRRSAEIALQDSERKFASFMENTPAMSWIRNDRGEFTFVNSTFCQVFSVEKEDVLGQRSLDGISDELRHAGSDNDRKVLESRNNVSVVQAVKSPDGKIRHWLVLKFPMLLSSGVELIGATAFDITDRIEAEGTLAATTKTLRALIDSSPLPILTLDLDGLVRVWSPACEKLFGWSADEVVGQPLPFVPAYRKGESTKIIDAIVKSGTRGYQTEVLRTKRDGNPVEIRIEGKALIDEVSGKPNGIVAVMTDISNQKLAERKLQEAKAQAELAAQIKSDFLANVSHEIRTPLNGIIGMTDILLESGLTEEQRKYATIVHNSGGILLNLINDILDLSKMEAGKMTLEKTPFSLVSLVETNADLLIAKARQSGLSLMTYVDSNLPSQVIGDPSRLAQILVNLIGNAIKFTHTGGVSIRVSLEQPNIYDGPTTARVCFEVQDTGIGLSENARKKLFTPFTQAESSTTRRFGGTGLGLSISKSLIEHMGGSIGVDSREGEGSTFWFVVPLENAAAPSSLERKELEKARILIVDEDSIACDVVTRYLKAWGIDDCVRASYKEALTEIIRAQADRSPYDVVLVGQGKKMSLCYDLAAEIRYGLGGLAPKMILMTPFEVHLTSAGLKESNFMAVLSKPIKQSQFFDILSRISSGDVLTQTHLPLAEANREIPLLPGGGSATTEKMTSAPPNPVKTAANTTGLRVLVADDVSTNQIIALKLLESLGHSGHAVANGREAVEALELRSYDLILMDCQMPEMDGFAATRLIRASKNALTANVVIIALTANAMAGDRERCLEAGMNDYLSKPIKKDKLGDAIGRWSQSLKKHG